MDGSLRLVRYLMAFDGSSFSFRRASIVLVGSIAVALGGYLTYYCYNYRQLTKLKGGYDSLVAQENVREYKIEKNELRVRLINLDNSLLKQQHLLKWHPSIIEVPNLGPYLRMECSFRYLWKFEEALARATGSDTDEDEWKRPLVTFYGSNDFHHLALPLIRRWRTPFNLVLFDNHPDWFQYYPGQHCGCWFTQAVRLPTCQQAFHFGGASGEFTDYWGFHPWEELTSGKIAVFPLREKYSELKWPSAKHVTPLRGMFFKELTVSAIKQLLDPFKDQLRAYPLYITLDKDCMYKHHNYQNWNSGSLGRMEVIAIIKVLIEMSGGNLLAIDITGEFSPVTYHGYWRHYMHKTEHCDEQNDQDPDRALETNIETNKHLMDMLRTELIKKPTKRRTSTISPSLDLLPI